MTTYSKRRNTAAFYGFNTPKSDLFEFSGMRLPRSFSLLAPSACPYLAGEEERKLVAWLGERADVSDFSALNRRGFRRSHDFIYKPFCGGCKACKALRVQAKDFLPGRTQRRIYKTNDDLELKICPNEATDEQYDLFHAYVTRRHYAGGMSAMDRNDFKMMIEESGVETSLFEWRQKESSELLACCLVDSLDDGFSAVYSFFDPDYVKRSLGVYMILSLIEFTQKFGMPYVYLGFWVRGSEKMDYKSLYKPCQILEEGEWRDFDANEDINLA